MTKICPSCGYREPDMSAQYCNKCGYPFPQSQQRKPAAAPAPSPSPGRRQAAQESRPAPRTRMQRSRGSPALGSLITENYLKLIYVAGAALIMLLAILGLAGMFGKAEAGGANISVTNLTAVADRPAASPLFWIGFLLAGSILWRMFCELFVLLSRSRGAVHDNGEEYDEENEEEDRAGPGMEDRDAYEGTMIECPKCHRIVPTDDLRVCEHCGIQGCSNCIRSMGLLKKTLTCRECFEGN